MELHHDFNDTNDPEAYPPTPHPVGLWLEEEDDMQMAKDASGEMPAPEDSNDALLHGGTQEPMHLDHVNFLGKSTREGSKATPMNGNVNRKTLLRDDLFEGHPDHERLLGQVEGMIVGRHVLVKGQYPAHNYKLCGTEMSSALLAEVDGHALDPARGAGAEKPAASHIDGKIPDSVSKDSGQLVALENAQTTSDGVRAVDAKEAEFAEGSPFGSPFGSSPFSDVPSDLSEWEVEDQVKSSYRAETPVADLEHEAEIASHENREDDLKRSTKTEARSGSIDSAVDVPAKRRSTRLFLKN
ncbi:uncharacterized protein N0V89_009699 [Didymosphaeria variabile]|uniref:Uncharacterized protein n=1 Tax=Didymosphaeria variabile TaxID=1932322 RepID=A0A9W8XE83_9PLEO|nr:uncharacterized protein N0V89_009699 [Didymosphaeria variabile]KAJ4348325.1 hypothetical protein N0V89_009699 [Didymosphaeria variabile]